MELREPAGHWVGNTFKLEPPVSLPVGEDVTVVLRLPEVGADRVKTCLGLLATEAVSVTFRSPGRWPLAELTPSPSTMRLERVDEPTETDEDEDEDEEDDRGE